MASNIESLSGGMSFADGGVKHAADVNRYLGGAERTVESHPYVKGYFYVFFGLPASIFDSTSGSTNGNDITRDGAIKYMLSAAEGFTPPGDRQLKMEDVQGMGGVDASFLTGQTIDRNFSLQFRDYWGAPIFRIHRKWTEYLNPYFGGNTGLSKNGVYNQFAAGEYKGTCMVIQTKPITKTSAVEWSAGDIIKVDFFDGVIPTTDLKSAYDANITDNSIAKPTVQYRFDGFPLDETNPLVLEKALGVLKTVQYDKGNASPVIYDKLISDAQTYIPGLTNSNT